MDPPDQQHEYPDEPMSPSSSSPTIVPTPGPTSCCPSIKIPSAEAGPSSLPAGCSYGPLVRIVGKRIYSIPPTTLPRATTSNDASTGLKETQTRSGTNEEGEIVKTIWVDFPPHSPDNPYFFSHKRKMAIITVAFYFAFMTSIQVSAYSAGYTSMEEDLHMTQLQAFTGTSLYAWGFAIGPLVLAPLTEELGRFWFFFGSVVAFTALHLTGSLAQNTATVLIGRFLLGLSGCIGATVVSGIVADCFPANDRPMSYFTLSVTIAPGLAPVIFCWVEAVPSLEWRWIYWIQMIAMGVYIPIVYFVLKETRSDVLLQRRAKALRVERGMEDGGRYTARGEVDRKPFKTRMKMSLSRPIMFLFLEPVVTFFAIWAALVWGVFFIEVAGLPYVFQHVHGFSPTQSGLAYIAVSLGTFFGFCLNFLQDYIYVRRVGKDGVEARLYTPILAGFLFAIGCIIFGLTSVPQVTWVAPLIGIVILMTGAFTIYNCCFVYLSECYGSHASSAVAGMSFLRIFLGSSFPLFTIQMFETLTPRWSLFMLGCIALPLAGVPIIAFYKGQYIRDRSPLSKKLMAEERRRLELEGAFTMLPVIAPEPDTDFKRIA